MAAVSVSIGCFAAGSSEKVVHPWFRRYRTATKRIFLSKEKTYSSEIFFPFQRQILEQQTIFFSFSKTNHTATKHFFAFQREIG